MLPGGRPEDFEGNRVNCVPKGGPRFFNVIREGGGVGEFPVHGLLKIIHSLSVFQVCHIQLLDDLLPLKPSL